MNTSVPVTKLEPFTYNDFQQSFFGGIFWGLAVWGVITGLAWLVMIMRQRSGSNSAAPRSSSSEQPVIM